ncbi:hypothetical protein BDD12DRAFT_809588 [Trichophaea hybrida]|nr:hypothetical protein BDD12DRAFT_809588 [Trichophaea hybrida]
MYHWIHAPGMSIVIDREQPANINLAAAIGPNAISPVTPAPASGSSGAQDKWRAQLEESTSPFYDAILAVVKILEKVEKLTVKLQLLQEAGMPQSTEEAPVQIMTISLSAARPGSLPNPPGKPKKIFNSISLFRRARAFDEVRKLEALVDDLSEWNRQLYIFLPDAKRRSIVERCLPARPPNGGSSILVGCGNLMG